MESVFTIGQLAKRVGVNVEMLRGSVGHHAERTSKGTGKYKLSLSDSFVG